MAFASFGDLAGSARSTLPGRGPPVFAVHGQVYHAVATLEPAADKRPLYGQLYFYDPAEAMQQRLHAFEGLDEAVLGNLHKMLIYDVRSPASQRGEGQWRRAYNPYARNFMYMHELWQRQGACRSMSFRFKTGVSPDPRRYNTPRAADVAVVYEGETPPTNRVISVYPRPQEGQSELHRPSELSDHLDPMTYPILFPDGQPGWHPQLRFQSTGRGYRTKISMAEFYTYRLMTRDAPSDKTPQHYDMRRRVVVSWDGSVDAELAPAPVGCCRSAMPHAGGRLFQQWLVDVFTRIEGERVDWCRRNQPLLRCETLQGLADYIESGLPSSAQGAGAHQPCPEAASIPDANFAGEATPLHMQVSREKDCRTPLDPHADSPSFSGVPLPRRAPGRRVILPPSYSGSPRELRQCYLDAMAVVQRFGKPDLFVTMTANPSWPEIVANLRAGETAANRPDLTCRVFRLKLRALMEDLIKEGVMGRAVAYTWAVEFQKRGLPHAHILIILQAEDKPRTPADVDELVSAELPNPTTQPELYAAVCKHMRHGPCGPANPQCPCMDPNTKTCTRNYPREFQGETVFNLGGYPLYRRRRLHPGEAVARTTGPGYEQSSRWIVPYNPYLLLRYDCHLNVEVCTSIKAVKYLYKYIHKGPDRANLVVGEPEDEIAQHIDARYVAAPEAAWRIFRFPLHDKSHAVERLPVHLPRGQSVLFQEGLEHEAYSRALTKETKLEAYFNLNRERHALATAAGKSRAEPLPYQDTPLFYVWRDGRWQRRQRAAQSDRVIGRLYSAGMKEGERYYLRVLLQHIGGAMCYQDLLSKRGMDLQPLSPAQHHSTFREAALALGLLDDDQLAKETLDDAVAVTTVSAASLRRVFVMVLEWLPVPDAGALWTRYAQEMGEDFVRAGLTLEAAEDRALHEVQALIRERGLPLECYSLPEPRGTGNADWGTVELQRELDYDRQHEQMEYERLIKLIQACPEQLAAWEAIQSALAGSEANVVFIDGPAGSGKTTLYKAVLHQLRANGEIGLPHAILGLAALLMPGGRTTHSRYKLPVPLPLRDATCGVKPTSSRGRLLYRASVAIWDEIANAPLAAIEAVDGLYKDLTGDRTKPFGGKVMILGGDFRQIPPVIRRINQDSIRDHTLHGASFWDTPSMVKLNLSSNHRAAGDASYASFLCAVGDGTYSGIDGIVPSALHPASVRLPANIVDESMGGLELLSWVYPNPPSSTHDEIALAEYYAGRAVVTPTNADAEGLSKEMLGRLSTPLAVLLSRDEVLDATPAEKDQFPEDFLNGCATSGMPPHRLELRPGALVICLRSIAPDKGVSNGTRAVVLKVHRHLLELVLVTAPHTGKVVHLPRANCDSSAEGELPFTLRRRQFPVRLAWAMTINKSQGQDFKVRLGVCLPRPVFAHGQLYVALSRGSGYDGVRVVVEQDAGGLQGVYKGVEGHPDGTYTLNIVNRSLLTSSRSEVPGTNATQTLSPLEEEPPSIPMPEPEASSECEVSIGCSMSAASSIGHPLERCEEDLMKQDALDAAIVGEGLPGAGASETAVETPAVCGRCGRSGHLDGQCPSYVVPPLRHPDATSRGVGPHMRELDTDGILATTTRGKADGKDSNCLIDSLRQLLRPSAQVARIRRALQLEYRTGASRVTANNFLQFDFHVRAVIKHLGLDPSLFTATCVDLVHRGHGDVIGSGARKIYLARQGQNHFIPLFPRASRGRA